MTPELIAAIKDRIAVGRSKEEIQQEVMAVGYSEASFLEAYQVAVMNQTTISSEVGGSSVANAYATPTSYSASGEGAMLIGYGELFGRAWHLLLGQVQNLLKVGLVILVIGLAIGYFVFSLDTSLSFGYYFLIIPILMMVSLPLFILLYFVLTRALIARNLNLSLGQHTGWVFRHLWPLLVVTILTGLIIQIGFALLFIPGLIATIYLMFATLLVVNEKTTAIEAMKLSVRLVKGRFFALLGRLLVVNLPIIFIASIIMVFGMLISPLFFLPLYALILYYGICVVVALYESVRSLPLVK